MKITFNLTNCAEDLERYESREDLLGMMKGFDGVELMDLGEDPRSLIPPERVIGLHMSYFPCWLDFWRGNTGALEEEFDDRATWEGYYGGSGREAVLERFRRDLQKAHAYKAEYVVFHVSECSTRELFTMDYRHSDEEVIDATCEVLNELFREEDGSLALLVENLWQPGLTFTRPEMTARLMEGIRYPNKGIMLDTGHLLHTDLTLRTQEEGLDYIHAQLDAHGPLCRYVRGMHLHQSLTGEYCDRVRRDPPELKSTFWERQGQVFYHAFEVDKHQPFTVPEVKALVQRVAPEYLTFEFITESRQRHREYLAAQRKALGLAQGS